MADGFIAFELDLMGAVMNQLVPTLDAMASAPLSLANAQALPDAQGVYLLIYDGAVRYVGKTDAEAGLRTRLSRHSRKFEQRGNVQPVDPKFDSKTDKRLISFRPNGQKCYNTSAVRRVLAG